MCVLNYGDMHPPPPPMIYHQFDGTVDVDEKANTITANGNTIQVSGEGVAETREALRV